MLVMLGALDLGTVRVSVSKHTRTKTKMNWRSRKSFQFGGLLIGFLLVTPPLQAAPITVQRFKVLGSTVFNEWELSNITQPFEDQSITLEDLHKAADAVTRYYLDHGYLTSRAVIGNQTIENGTVYIQVIEGNLENIEIQGTRRVSQEYVRDRVQLAGRQPLNQESLENQLRLLRADPLFSNIEASLREGNNVGNSILNIRVTESKPLITDLGVDNYGAESVGAETLSATVGTRNLTGVGDTLLANHSQSSGSRLWNLSYQRPINAKQGTVLVRVAPSQYQITQPDLKELDISGTSNSYEITLRQPLSRQPQKELALSLGLVHRSGETLISDFLVDSSESTKVRFGQDFLKRDRSGIWLGRSQFNFGKQSDQSNFLTWTGQLQRFQSLGKNHLLSTEFSWQFTRDRLSPSQQFHLGGFQSLRGYAPNLLSGDNGIAIAIENQITLKRSSVGNPTLQVSPFIDLGTLWNQPSEFVSTEVRSFFASTGFGVTWQPFPKWSLRADIAFPLTPLGDTQNPILYFNSHYRF
jgi:hemolysin activation/secretion protein